MENIQTNKPSAFIYALKCAVVLSALLIAMHLLLYFTKQLENTWLGLVNILLLGIVVFFFVINFRNKHSDGYITFGKAFSLCLQIIIFSGIIRAGYDFIFNQYISPETAELIIRHTEDKLAAKGAPDDQIEASMKMAHMVRKPAVSFILSIIASAFGGSIVSLVVAAICKKESSEFLPDV